MASIAAVRSCQTKNSSQFDAPNEQRLGCRFSDWKFLGEICEPAAQYDNAV